MSNPEARSKRDQLRASIFASKKPSVKVISFFGTLIEIRQPKLREILAAQTDSDREAAVINTLVAQAFVPGTDEKIFEEADRDALMEMPFGPDFVGVVNAIQELSDVNFLDKKGS